MSDRRLVRGGRWRARAKLLGRRRSGALWFSRRVVGAKHLARWQQQQMLAYDTGVGVLRASQEGG